MDHRKCTSFGDPPSMRTCSINFLSNLHAKTQMEDHEECGDLNSSIDVEFDLKEVYFLILHFLSDSPCQKAFKHLADELLEHKLLPRRYHAWYSRTGTTCGEEDDDGTSFNLIYENLVKRYSHIEKSHLVKLLKQLLLTTSPPLRFMVGNNVPSAADVPTLLGTGSFSLLSSERNNETKRVRNLPSYLRWPHMQADQVRGLRLREIGGGFSKHHRAPSTRYPCYAIAKPLVLVPKMQNNKKLRGHRDAVYCAIFDRHGRYVITGSDDRLVKIWSMETAFCLASCRGHEGDITDLSVNSNNYLVASASNDYSIRVWRIPDGQPISVLRGHTGAVTAIAFCPRPTAIFQLLSSSDDGSCRIWDARYSQCSPRVYVPKPMDPTTGKSISIPSASTSSSNAVQRPQILCCAFNVGGTVFVTGSSDTFARVWNACKPSTDNPEQPSYEIDILAGHENDVNYVQFSGCAVAARSSPIDASIDDSLPKFKNTWFSHDSIVTCSRDGSAIIWIPRSRRSHVKTGRWIRAYHLKVPPPPMPPQPPRGGPRQRLLPTPRGVNMIVWSLDNRFVLAAIMDNRICVWNANDGSLVHSLAGHTASTYVLDVHPFNPRIAMSAGYDGKTILWDIWEGTPIREYEIDVRFKLVDGKFSQDGTSIVLSDDVGQIYLLSTGEGESQKDAKYDQFFLGDYRPLIQDASGNVIDQETQLTPHHRNLQDTLCDSSMLPYPEPYQSMYQRRRLGTLGVEWHPSSIKFAIGTDIGIGQEFQIRPLPDLDVAFEPLPDYLDAMYWEPENEVMNDDNDSEYNVTEDNVSEDQICVTDSASNDSECSEDNKVRRNHKDNTRRSKKNTHVLELKLSSGRRVKKRTSEEQEGMSSRSKRHKRSKWASRRKRTEAKSLRPQRVAARNAINNLSQITEDSTDKEDEDGCSSTSESSFEESPIHIEEEEEEEEYDENLYEQIRHSPDGSEDVVQSHNHPSKKKLVLKFSLNPRTVLSGSENHTSPLKSQDNSASSFSIVNPNNDKVNTGLLNVSPSLSLVDEEFSEIRRNQSGVVDKPTESDNDLKPFPISSGVSVNWARVKLRTSNAHIKEDGMSSKQDFGNEEKDLSNPHLCGTSNIPLDLKGCPQNSSKKNTIKIKIKSSKSRGDSPKPQVNTSSHTFSGASGKRHVSVEEENCLEFPTASNKYAESDHLTRSHVKFDENSSYLNLDTDAVRRSRSLKLKATSQSQENVANNDFETGSEYLQPCTSKASGKSRKKDIEYFSQVGDVFGSRYNVKPRSARKKGEGYGGGNRSGLVRSSEQIHKKLNWLLLLEQEEGYRYIPQMGDIVVYMRQGHQGYLDSINAQLSGPWVRFGNKLRAFEVCMVEDLKYTTVSGSGLSCCKLTLTFLDASPDLTGQTFQLKLPELIDFPDFIVEKTRFDVSMERNWGIRDICWVWWRDDIEAGGQWWDGVICDVRDKSGDFPGSPWERYVIKYENDTVDHFHCPWELHDEDRLWDQPKLDYETKEIISLCFVQLMQKASKDQDRYGILKLNEVAQKLDFQNRFPVPLSPEIIQARLERDYYRNVKAIKHDMAVMLSNAENYFLKNLELLKKMQRLSKWFDRELSYL